MTGTLIVAATPIGNPGDASERLKELLSRAPIIAAEDTRRVRRLSDALGVHPRGRIVSLFEGNEARRTSEIVELLRNGTDVLLVSDAGTPAVSDPGHRLLAECAAADLPITVLPGPSAVVAALVVSGLPTDRFCFEGFLPRRGGPRRRRLAELAREPRTIVLFESPRRTVETLDDLVAVAGPDRRAAVCRELTKTHEEIRRGPLVELRQWAGSGVLGEVVIVMAGAPAVDEAGGESAREWARDVARLVEDGMTRRDAVAQVAGLAGVSRRVVYAAVHAKATGGPQVP